MKINEFIKYFEDEGYETMFDDYCDKSVLFINENHELLLCVSEGDRIDTDYCAFNDLDQSKKQEYYKVIFEYLMTPIEEREDEKKFYLRQKGMEDYNAFLSYERFDDRYFTDNKKEHGQYITQFTQSEIDELPEYYKHPAVWEQIEVECEDID